MNGTIKIKGGNPLKGEVTPIPNKNAIVAALPASILSDKTITYKNVPKSSDVKKILEMLKMLGAEIDTSFSSPSEGEDRGMFNNLKINCKNLNSYAVDKKLGGEIRASILFAGPLLARFGKAKIPLPGGCVLGKRSIAAHLDVFNAVGIKAEFFNENNGKTTDSWVEFTAPEKLEDEYKVWQWETSVTATENFVLYASGRKSNFTITNAASEPHVTQLVELLSNMGASIKGIGSNKLEISGTDDFKEADFKTGPDHVDIATYITAAAVTKGKIRIKDCYNPVSLDGIIKGYEKLGVDIKVEEKDIIVEGSKDLKVDWKESGLPLAADGLPKFLPGPWPGFPVDILPLIVSLATQIEGKILIKNWMYESGLDFVSQLNRLGANIYKIDPERVVVFGNTKFEGGEVYSPGIIQATMAIFLCSLVDSVETTLHGSDVLYRRYSNFVEVFKSLGADIEVIK